MNVPSPSQQLEEVTRAHSSQNDKHVPAPQKNGNLSSPRSVASTKTSTSKNIFTERNAPSAPFPATNQGTKPPSSSFLPPLMSMLSLSFESEDESDEQDNYDRTGSTSSTERHTDDGMPLLRSILKSPLYKACTSGSAGCNPSTAMHKSVSFSKKLNEVKSIAVIDQQIKSKQRSQSMSNLRSPNETKIKNTNDKKQSRNHTLSHFTSSLTCVSNLTCDSFRYYSTAVDDNAIPMMSVYNIDDDNEEDWEGW